MMAERGKPVNQSNIYSRVQKFHTQTGGFFPEREEASSRQKLADGTYIKTNDQWKYLYRAIDKGVPDHGFPARQ